uniref:Putative secreted protein n=1 Tax=Anopheles marajoara TaxID=58244 RepID=A0A2M4C693_9DIPT
MLWMKGCSLLLMKVLSHYWREGLRVDVICACEPRNAQPNVRPTNPSCSRSRFRLMYFALFGGGKQNQQKKNTEKAFPLTNGKLKPSWCCCCVERYDAAYRIGWVAPGPTPSAKIPAGTVTVYEGARWYCIRQCGTQFCACVSHRRVHIAYGGCRA